MTPQEKAKDLVDKFAKGIKSKAVITNPVKFAAKECALIAVEEILHMVKHTPIEDIETEYWQEVKQEIEKL